jgi:hypothetical protein
VRVANTSEMLRFFAALRMTGGKFQTDDRKKIAVAHRTLNRNGES